MNRRQFLKSTALTAVTAASPKIIYASTRGPDDEAQALVRLHSEIPAATDFQQFSERLLQQIADGLGLPYETFLESRYRV